MRRKDPTEWRKKVAAWKNGTPTSELFNLPHYDGGTDEEDPPSVKLSREIMSILRGGDFASSRIESGEPGESDALATYLLSRKQLRELFLKHGYIESPKDYGLVKKAVGKRDLPVYQRSEDQIDRESVIPIGNIDSFWGGDKTDGLVHAGDYPTAVYLDPKTLDLYQKAWDLNDYGPSSGGTATRYGFPKQIVANLLDLIGSPVVVTTGMRKIKYPNQDEFLNLKDNYMKSKGYHIIEDYEDVPLYDMSGKNVIGKFSEKTKRYTLPEITVTAPKKHDKGKSIKPLPHYDYGTDDNPWIPKGAKVPTENSQEVRVSALPKTTTVSKSAQSIDDNLTEQERGLAYLRHLYNVDKPLSGTDPIGEMAVEGAALGPVFKGLGWVGKQTVKQAMPYLGRILKPVTNWFAAKALSSSIDDAVATPTLSKVLPATEQIWQDLNLPRRSYLSGSMSGPFTEEIFRRNGIFDAFDAFDNPARKQLVDRLSEEAGFPLLVPMGHGKFPGTIKFLTDSDADKILGKNVLGKRDGYTLYVRESADPTTVFHEALHLQGFGNVDWNWSKLLSLLNDYKVKGSNLALLESSGAPFMLIRDAKRDYYAAEQAYKQLFELKNATEQFLLLKVNSVLVDDAEEYIRQPHEFVVHGLQAGRKVGLKPYQPEPTYDPYNTGVPIVDFGKIMETVHSAIKKHDWMADLKLDTPLDYHNAWKVLTGNFLPATVITGGTFGALQEHDKGKSIHIKPANKGKFKATMKRTGKTAEQLKHSKNPLTRKRAIFALNSRKFKH